MATSGTTDAQTDDQPVVVRRGIEFVEDGLCTVDELDAPDESDLTDGELRQAVRDGLADSKDDGDDRRVEQVEDNAEGTITSARGVDWPALWQEFGFDSPDSEGARAKSKTKVAEALQVTDQPVNGDVQQIITDAVENGTLSMIEASAEDGTDILKGFILEVDA